jgi:uncharacterized protein with HEPN domain
MRPRLSHAERRWPNPLTHYAVLRALEIVSEASRHLPVEIKARHPKIKWRAMRTPGTSTATSITK